MERSMKALADNATKTKSYFRVKEWKLKSSPFISESGRVEAKREMPARSPWTSNDKPEKQIYKKKNAAKLADSPRILGLLVGGGRRSQQTVLPGICGEQKTTCSQVVLLS